MIERTDDCHFNAPSIFCILIVIFSSHMEEERRGGRRGREKESVEGGRRAYINRWESVKTPLTGYVLVMSDPYLVDINRVSKEESKIN